MEWHPKTMRDPSVRVANDNIQKHSGPVPGLASAVGDWLTLLLGSGIEWLFRSAGAPTPAVLLEFKKRDIEIARIGRGKGSPPDRNEPTCPNKGGYTGVRKSGSQFLP